MNTTNWITIATLAVYLIQDFVRSIRSKASVKASINTALSQNRAMLGRVLSDIVAESKTTGIVGTVEHEVAEVASVIDGAAHSQAGTNG